MHEIPLRLTVVGPPLGVAWAVQSGRSDLIEPSERTEALIAFDVTVRVGAPRSGGHPTLLGRVTQGPPTARFVYVNSGKRAGQVDSCWDRPAKVPLTGITQQLIEGVEKRPGARLGARIAGTASDGGPACATVPLLEGGWRVVAPAAPPQERISAERSHLHETHSLAKLFDHSIVRPDATRPSCLFGISKA